MKIKTSELKDKALDYVVAKIESGIEPEYFNDCIWITTGSFFTRVRRNVFEPSTNWSQGGPIIERERITISALFAQINPPIPDFDKNEWGAYIPYGTTERGMGAGPTPLIAAMRSYVACKLGDEVEIPEELK